MIFRRLGLIVGLLPAPLAAQEVAWEGGLSFAQGTYGLTERTTGWLLANGLAFTAGRFTARVSWPVLVQRAPSLTTAAADGDPTAGDPMALLSVRLGARRLAVTLSAAAKAPTADTVSFGTGEWDAGAGLSLTRVIGRGGFVGADVFWWYLGDPPWRELKNPVLASASIGAVVASAWGLSASVSGATPIIEGSDASVSVGGGVSRFLGPAMIGVTAYLGLTDAAPDVSLGATWRVRL